MRIPSLLGGHSKCSGDDNGRSEERHDQIDGEPGNRCSFLCLPSRFLIRICSDALRPVFLRIVAAT